MKSRKPTVYLAPYITGNFSFEPVKAWLAKDRWGNTIARARTRRECEQEARRAGYVPVRDI